MKETRRNLSRDAKQGNKRNIRQYIRFSLGYNCTKRLSEVKAPVLLLFGDKDRMFKRYSALLLRELPHVELVLIRKTKHQLPTKAPDAVNETIRHWIHSVAPAGIQAGHKETEIRTEAYPTGQAAIDDQPHV